MTSLLDYKKIDLNNITDNNNNTMTDNKMDLTKLSKTELLLKCSELGILNCTSKNKCKFRKMK